MFFGIEKKILVLRANIFISMKISVVRIVSQASIFYRPSFLALHEANTGFSNRPIAVDRPSLGAIFTYSGIIPLHRNDTKTLQKSMQLLLYTSYFEDLRKSFLFTSCQQSVLFHYYRLTEIDYSIMYSHSSTVDRMSRTFVPCIQSSLVGQELIRSASGEVNTISYNLYLLH